MHSEAAFVSGYGFFRAVRLLEFEARVGGEDFVALLEFRALIPKRTRDDVRFAVVIEVADVGALRPELVGELDFFERMNAVSRIQAKRKPGQNGRGEKSL